jgi:hypothetical protein
LRQLVDNRWFALTDLLLVIMSAVAWMLIPRFGIGFSLIALLPWVLRLLAGYFPFQRTPFDWLIAIFLITAWVGYWAAYDKTAAWIKVWLLVSAVLLYYAISAQPKQNFGFLSFLSFCFALTVAIYFFLSYDFTGGGGLATWWMNHRPQVNGPAIPPGHTSGILVISGIFAFYWVWTISKKSSGSAAAVIQLFLIFGTAMIVLVSALTISRRFELIGMGVIGLWILWRISTLAPSHAQLRIAFPILVLMYVTALIIVGYLGQAQAAAGPAPGVYGTNSRTELFGRSVYLLLDYPITGAGLGSFPGVYSQYVLVIPFFYFTNSYNLFLDVAIEQGLIAGSISIILYVGTLLLVAKTLVNAPTNELRLMRWLVLFALIVTIVHGIFYDYLYNGNGTVLLFYPLGMAMIGAVNQSNPTSRAFQLPTVVSRSQRIIIGTLFAVIVALTLNLNRIISFWYANVGAVQMSQVELKDFPTGQWATSEVVPRLDLAYATLHSALQYDSRNQTANYRLGLISMLQQDFRTAAANLEAAYQEAPNHRGIIKSLGYCYVWLGDMDKARLLLKQIPEAQHEMSVYIWWWETQGRPDLSQNASTMVSQLDLSSK